MSIFARDPVFARFSYLVNEMQRELASISRLLLEDSPMPGHDRKLLMEDKVHAGNPDITDALVPFVSNSLAPFSVKSIMVPIDMTYDRETYEIKMDVPGMTGTGIRVSIEPGNMLIVTGERTCPQQQVKSDMNDRNDRTDRTESNERSKMYTERFYGKFSRSIKLPDDIDTGKVDASVHNGILTIKIGRKVL